MSEPGLRERKKAITRAQIIETANRLFLERGYEDVTLDEVANECVISVRTVLRYFDTKEALALAEEYDALEKFRTGLQARTGSVLDYWRYYVGMMTAEFAARSEWNRERRELIRSSSLSAAFLHLQRTLQHILADALEAEASNTDDPMVPQLLAAVLLAGHEAVMADWLDNEGPIDPNAVLRAIDYACEIFEGRITLAPASPAGS